MLVVITGPSGVGKTTIIKLLLQVDSKLKYSVSLTTRQPRYNEADGVDYRFVSREYFQKAIADGELVEWSEVYGEYYGRLKKDLDELMCRNDALIGIDVQGALKLQEKYPEGVFIFLMPKSNVALKKQLRGRRTEDEASIKKRFDASLQEIEQAGKFEHIVVNDRIWKTVEEVQYILNIERNKE